MLGDNDEDSRGSLKRRLRHPKLLQLRTREWLHDYTPLEAVT